MRLVCKNDNGEIIHEMTDVPDERARQFFNSSCAIRFYDQNYTIEEVY